MWDIDFDSPVCHNTGYMRITCPECLGHGVKPERVCHDCGGDGVIKEYCDRCDGEGEIEKECAHCRR